MGTTQIIAVGELNFGYHGAGLTVASAVWVATALLHQREPGRESFAIDEIVAEVMRLELTSGLDKSVKAHVMQHCVSNKKPDPNRACILFEPRRGLRRLFRPGDEVYAGKDVNRTHPDWEDLPAEYGGLRDWYEREWIGASSLVDPLLALAGTWTGERADAYVSALRAGWEARS